MGTHTPVNDDQRIVEISVAPEHRDDSLKIRELALRKAGLSPQSNMETHVVRRSLDARKDPRFLLKVVIREPEAHETIHGSEESRVDVSSATTVYIIGAGPAGYFAALELIKLGIRPVVIERGKDVRERRRDLRGIQQHGVVNPDSNYCFGEGGAGTYSDGKLYTRATKRGDVGSILQTLVQHGAHPDILVDAHPHIGSNKLPGIVAAIRETILNAGGEVRFNTTLTGLTIRDNRLTEIHVNDNTAIPATNVILATGHSARDIYTLLNDSGVLIEFKPFALGVRVEHPQQLIDEIQYGRPRGEWLPAAAYQLTCQIDKRGVFSFCMCPGGLIVPAATAPGEIVVNGMSLSRRDSPFANSGMVTAIDASDLGKQVTEDALSGITFQRSVEQACFEAGDGSQKAPAQRITDFISGKMSTTLPSTSYIPGLFSHQLGEVLPSFVTKSLRDGLRRFGKLLPGYLTEEAIAVATESRTSSPVRIPRNADTFEHPQVEGLFPCGEGAGYAGGIVSAAIDGQNVARAVAARVSVSSKSDKRRT